MTTLVGFLAFSVSNKTHFADLLSFVTVEACATLNKLACFIFFSTSANTSIANVSFTALLA